MIDLHSVEAEEKVIGFLFNPYYNQEKKSSVLAIITGEHFVDNQLRHIYLSIKMENVYDKIVLWEKIKKLPATSAIGLEWPYIDSLDDLVTDSEAESYSEILQDKLQKRYIYDFGKYVQEAMIKGEDQFEVALKAQKMLTSMSGKIKVDSNQQLLNKVLSTEKRDIISTGFTHLDHYLGGYSRGMIITIAGDSGHMKTTFAMEKAFRMAEKNPDLRIGIFSKEMLAEDLMRKQISRICKIPISKIFAQDYDKEEVKRKMEEVEVFRNNRLQIVNPNLFSGVSDLARIQMTYKYDIWFLDFIQLLEFSKAASSSSDYNIQVGQNMRNLQSLALATKSVGIVLSQVKKGIEQRSVKKPTISDIEWSGLIKQLSTYIFFSYYPGKYYGFHKFAEDNYFLLGEKTRFAESFTYPVNVDPELGIFHELSDSERQKRVKVLREIG